MKPPVIGSHVAFKRQQSRGRSGRGSARRRIKKPPFPSPLVHPTCNTKENESPNGSFLSPAHKVPRRLVHGSIFSPPRFDLSFGSDLSDELLSCVDKLDGSLACSSTPLDQHPASNPASDVASSKTALARSSPASPSFTTPDLDAARRDLHSSSALSDGAAFTGASSFMVTPSREMEDRLSLSSWGLPEKVLRQYAKRGVVSMFEWQAECLSVPGVLTGSNLVFSAPTSAGKTLVAELLALKCVLELQKKVIIILPFVSIAQEKSAYLQGIFKPVGVRVGGFMGGQAPPGGFAAVDVAICTIEKANSLVNRLLEEKATQQLGTVVVDELHMIGDLHRGYLLELLLTKLMYICGKGRSTAPHRGPDMPSTGCQSEDATSAFSLPSSERTVQLVGMSATLPNLPTLAMWLGARLYRTDFRPVPLKEMVKIGSVLYDAEFRKIQAFDRTGSFPGDEDDILLICRERVVENHLVLIFCPTKSWCENLAVTIARALLLGTAAPADQVDQGSSGAKASCHLDRAGLLSVCEQLRRTQVGLDRTLQQCVPSGVAFHHAGLTFEEREIIEGAFRQCLIKILVATSTLSSGVNLPARVVIVRTPFFQRSLLDVLVYKQMVGRAGRKGVDSAGESILICKESERAKVVGLLKSAPRPVRSCLADREESGTKESSGEHTAMRRALLEVIASGTATTEQEIEAYAKCTLLFAELSLSDSESAAHSKQTTSSAKVLLDSALQFLVENEFVAAREQPGPSDTSCPSHPQAEPPPTELYATQLGMATVASSLSPTEALVVFSDLQKARRSFVLANELHTVYLVTPVYIQKQWPSIDWYRYLCLWERLPPDMRHVAEVLGTRESFLARAVQGRLPERTAAQKESLRVHRRFFTALALHDLVHEVPMVEVASKYGVSKGLLQTLQGAAGTFAGMVTTFCRRLGWSNLELLLSQFQDRLTFGVERELCDLVKVSLLNGFRARVLYNAGFHTLAALAAANPITVETCLRNAVPFRSHRTSDHDDCTLSVTATTWCAELRRGMSESDAARLIVSEAQGILSKELNIPTAAWGHTSKAALSEGPAPHEIQAKASSPSFPTCQTAPPGRDLVPGTLSSAVEPKPALPPTSEAECTSPKASSSSRPSRKSPDPDHREGAGTEEHVGLLKRPRLHQQDRAPQPETSADPMPSSPAAGIEHERLIHCQSRRPRSPTLDRELTDIQTPSRGQCKPQGPGQSFSPSFPFTIPDSMLVDMSLSFSFHASARPSANPMAGAAPVVSPTNDMARERVNQDHTGKKLALESPIQVTCIAESPMESVSSRSNSNAVASTPGAHLQEEAVPASSSSSLTVGGFLHSAILNLPATLNPRTVSTPVHPQERAAGDSLCEDRGKALNPFEGVTTPLSLSPQLPLSQGPSLRELSSLCASQMSQSGVTIIEVTSNPVLLETFIAECLEQTSVSFSVATLSLDSDDGIGSTVAGPRRGHGIHLAHQNRQVVGVAFCWGELDAYYVSLCHDSKEEGESKTCLRDSIALDTRIRAVRRLLDAKERKRQTLIAYDVKSHAKSLALSCGILPEGWVMDPKVASWMLDPDAKEKTIHKMVLQYLPEQPVFSEGGEGAGEMPLSSLVTHSSDPQLRASAESVLASLLMVRLGALLEEGGLTRVFLKTEMPSLLVLTKMELNGIGFSPDECNNQRDVLQKRVSELERSAYTLARHTFSLTSPEDVAQVLYVELKLPAPSSDSRWPQLKRTLGPNGRRSKCKLRHLSTAKDVLEKIKHLHPLPGIVLEWRRISSTLTKTVFPLCKDVVLHQQMGSARIHPTCQVHTATGRVTVLEPSLQMVPKEYDIGTEHVCSPGAKLPEATTGKGAAERSAPPSSVCMRDVFVSFPGGVFLAADYSQLELRILAHLSSDRKLQRFLKSRGDVFKMIAGEWLAIPPDSVSERQRQEAKQVCYGMVYGIGCKALGEQLDITEDEAARVIESFKMRYPTMQKYLAQVVAECRERGHVCTLLGRKRFLPAIHSHNSHTRSQAERQAVNTTVQGSAADLVKAATVNIDRRLSERFPDSPLSLADATPADRSSGSRLRGAFLVLQLHDELLYEVAVADLAEVAEVVRSEMENAMRLSVPLPVKVKVGPSWGRLEPYC